MLHNYYGIKRALRRTKGIKNVFVRPKKGELVIYSGKDKEGRNLKIKRG